MKLKQVALLVLGLFVSGQALGMLPIPGTPRARESLLEKTNREIARLQTQYRQEYSRLPGKAEVPEELEKLPQKIKEKQAFANYIREAIEASETPEVFGAGTSEMLEEIGASETALFAAGVSETPAEREIVYNNLLADTNISSNDKEIRIKKLLQRARSEGDVWVNRLSDPQEEEGVPEMPQTPEKREKAYYNLLTTTNISANDKEVRRADLLQRARSEGDLWVKELYSQERFGYSGAAAVPPSPPSSPSSPSSSQPSSSSSPSSSWITPQRGVLAGLLGLGYVYHKVPEWMKNRIKRILKEHGKKFSDLDRAEKDLLMSASRARFNPAGAFFFQEAVLDMPTDFKLRDELWPILNHVYYGKKEVSQKQARELRELYDEAQELMEID